MSIANEITVTVGTVAIVKIGRNEVEVTVTEITANGWTGITALCVMVFSLFHWPCSTTLLTIYRETHSKKWTRLSALRPTLLGILCCLLIHRATTRPEW